MFTDSHKLDTSSGDVIRKPEGCVSDPNIVRIAQDGSAKSVETKKHPCSKAGDDGMKQ